MTLKTIRGEVVDMPAGAIMGAEFIDPLERIRDHSYTKFLEGKVTLVKDSGFGISIEELNPMLFPFQKAIPHK